MKNEEESSKKIIKRQTLEAVFQAQERLRKHLDELIEENRPIKDNKERDMFFRELTYSTLGLGKKYEIGFSTYERNLSKENFEKIIDLNQDFIKKVEEAKDRPSNYPDKKNHVEEDFSFGSVEKAARSFAYYKGNIAVFRIVKSVYPGYVSGYINIPIGFLWDKLRTRLFAVFPEAIDRATSLSKETEETSKSSGYQING